MRLSHHQESLTKDLLHPGGRACWGEEGADCVTVGHAGPISSRDWVPLTVAVGQHPSIERLVLGIPAPGSQTTRIRDGDRTRVLCYPTVYRYHAHPSYAHRLAR